MLFARPLTGQERNHPSMARTVQGGVPKLHAQRTKTANSSPVIARTEGPWSCHWCEVKDVGAEGHTTVRAEGHSCDEIARYEEERPIAKDARAAGAYGSPPNTKRPPAAADRRLCIYNRYCANVGQASSPEAINPLGMEARLPTRTRREGRKPGPSYVFQSSWNGGKTSDRLLIFRRSD